jgi:hypothetical protein
MARKSDTYAQTRKARAKVYPVTVTFAYGRELTGVMDLSVAQLEQLRSSGEITADAYCVTCGEHVTDCPNMGTYLLEWPATTGWRYESGLVEFTR